ncbi:MAG: hypothetical protein WCO65_01880 [bacterium]
MSWSFRRQLFIILLLCLVFAGVVFAYVAPIIFQAPTCSDHKQNGTETGVDCGGGCVNLCTSDVKKPTILWYRSFLISDDVYNAVAYIENQNSAAITAMPYEFRLYDTKGTYITRVDGTAMIPPSGRYAIIETGIKTGTAIVGTTTFEWKTPTVSWQHIAPNISSLRIGTSDISLNTSSSTQRLLVTVNNKSPIIPLKNVQVAAILYDKDDNAVSVSKTYIHELTAGGNLPIYFTWPRPFANPVVRYEIIPIIDVFSTGAIK